MLRLSLILSVTLTACIKDETISGYADRQAVFALDEINGAPFAANATISFPTPGEVVGNGPCNAYAATQNAPLPWFEMGPIRATKRACADLTKESEFFAALSRMSLIEVSGHILILRNDAGEMMIFDSRQQ